jgi:hypothetical protein
MAPVSGTSAVYATVLDGIQRAQRSTSASAQQSAAPGAIAPVDSAEFSDAAMSASCDSIAAAAVTISQARTQTAAMVLLARAEQKMQGETLDLLA